MAQKSFSKLLKTVGSNLQAFRTVRKKDIETVAEAIKISPALLQKIEKGKYDIDLDLLFMLCRYYEVPPSDSFKEDVHDKDMDE